MPYRRTPEQRLVDYYEILQVSPKADRDTIERVYRHLAKRWHPDNRETGDSARFAELVDAYRVLSDAERRASYDVGYERVREARWRIYSEEGIHSEVAADRRIRLAIMSILYVTRRNNPFEPGLGAIELERLLDCPEPTVKFHLWYMRENGWIERCENGTFAITANGVDKLFELGGPQKSGPQLLTPGEPAYVNGASEGTDDRLS